MKKGFIAAFGSVVELKEIITLMEQYGVDNKNIVINQNFEEFTNSLQSGDVVVIPSYADVFMSLPYFLTKYIELSSHGIAIESVMEPSIDISAQNIALIKLLSELGTSIRISSTQRGLTKAKSEGKKLGRPYGSTKLDNEIKEVERLKKETNLSVLKACKIVGCEPRTYYRYREKIRKAEATLSQEK